MFQLNVIEHDKFDDVPGHFDGFKCDDVSSIYEKQGEAFHLYKSYDCENDVTIEIINLSNNEIVDTIRYNA